MIDDKSVTLGKLITASFGQLRPGGDDKRTFDLINVVKKARPTFPPHTFEGRMNECCAIISVQERSFKAHPTLRPGVDDLHANITNLSES